MYFYNEAGHYILACRKPVEKVNLAQKIELIYFGKLCENHNQLKCVNLIKKKSQTKFETFRAKDEARTRDNQLGRLELYQLSYFRLSTVQI